MDWEWLVPSEKALREHLVSDKKQSAPMPGAPIMPTTRDREKVTCRGIDPEQAPARIFSHIVFYNPRNSNVILGLRRT